MASHFIELLLLAVAWLAYGALHSLLASNGCKAWCQAHWPQQMHGYRIAFNSLAFVLLIPILALERGLDAVPLWAWTGPARAISLSLMGAAVAGFIWSTRYYNMGHFIGSHQWRNKGSGIDGDSEFTISPLHRFVRHPWYSLALVILWVRDIESTTLVTNLVVSAYFIVGARLEENKLVGQFGERYREYQRLVPAIAPNPWRYLSLSEAERLNTSKNL